VVPASKFAVISTQPFPSFLCHLTAGAGVLFEEEVKFVFEPVQTCALAGFVATTGGNPLISAVSVGCVSE
jgi:hypothetical protein